MGGEDLLPVEWPGRWVRTRRAVRPAAAASADAARRRPPARPRGSRPATAAAAPPPRSSRPAGRRAEAPGRRRPGAATPPGTGSHQLPVLGGAAGDDEPRPSSSPQPLGPRPRSTGQPVGEVGRHLLLVRRAGAAGAVRRPLPAGPAGRNRCRRALRRTRRAAAPPAPGAPPSSGAATIRPARSSARVAASATEVSVASRSAPRSQSVGAGSVPRVRRAASTASSVVRPLPGGPTSPRTAADPLSKAVNSRTTAARSTVAGATPSVPGEVGFGAVRAHRGRRECEYTCRIEIGPVAATVVALRSRSSVVNRDAGSAQGDRETRGRVGVQRGAEYPDHRSGRGVDDRPPGRPRHRPAGARPHRPAPIANSSASSRRWRRSVAASPMAPPSTRASRQPPAGIRQIRAGLDLLAHGDGGAGSRPRPSVRTSARWVRGAGSRRRRSPHSCGRRARAARGGPDRRRPRGW